MLFLNLHIVNVEVYFFYRANTLLIKWKEGSCLYLLLYNLFWLFTPCKKKQGDTMVIFLKYSWNYYFFDISRLF